MNSQFQTNVKINRCKLCQYINRFAFWKYSCSISLFLNKATTFICCFCVEYYIWCLKHCNIVLFSKRFSTRSLLTSNWHQYLLMSAHCDKNIVNNYSNRHISNEIKWIYVLNSFYFDSNYGFLIPADLFNKVRPIYWILCFLELLQNNFHITLFFVISLSSRSGLTRR